jgi:arylsulfatase A-like enzyme
MYKQTDEVFVQRSWLAKKAYLYPVDQGSHQTVFHKMLIVILLHLALSACNPQSPPNIVLVMADDLGYGDLGCYGGEHVATPNLDKLAASGVRFLDYHSNGAVCSPTRAALMTGRYQQRSGIEGVVTAARHRHTGLSTDELTIAEFLHAKGYHTGIFGKWHLGYDTAFSPLNNGFDSFRGYVSGNIDYHSHIDQAGIFDWWLNKDTLVEEGYVTDLITEHAIEFIEEHSGSPFFLYVSHEAPHYPYQGRRDAADRTMGGTFPNSGSRRDRKNAYREMIQAMDEGIGKLVSALERSGQLDNTFLFFCSDNGANSTGSNRPLKGFKGRLWEGGHRVPAIACWKGHILPDISPETILSMDLFPTIISLSGHPRPDDLEFDGIDFSQVFLSGESLPDRPVFWRFKNQQAVRHGPWKLILDGEEVLLYNLQSDLGEENNLAERYPVTRDSLRMLLDQWALEMDQYTYRTE